MASTIPFNSQYTHVTTPQTTCTSISSAMHVSKFRVPFRSKLILICICDMHKGQMGAQLKEQCSSAAIRADNGDNTLLYTGYCV